MTLPSGQTAAQSDEAAIGLVHSVIQADRQVVVAETLQVAERESLAFWPLYHRYRAEMEKVVDGLVRRLQEYARHYPSVSEVDLSQRKLGDQGVVRIAEMIAIRVDKP